ncbi:hypothetical protein AB0E08_40490 [Streptomyces sp. NPDC048281]|uniref:hypothetical protein n=1 Tax=Streptomyces sp. NPDC048281 TaxID=3154715 RepID=UPI00341983B3
MDTHLRRRIRAGDHDAFARSVHHHAYRLTGRKGVAITRTGGKVRVQPIFGEKTYVFPGERMYDLHGTSMGGTSVMARAVVDKAGERP